MKRDELIKKLLELPPDAELVIQDPGCGCCSGGYEDEIDVSYKNLQGKYIVQ